MPFLTPDDRLAFSNGLQLAWDSTSLSDYFTCPRRYYYSIFRGFQGRAVNVHFFFGELFHIAMERFDHARVKDELTQTTLITTIKEVWERSGTRAPDGTWQPWISDHKQKNLEGLIRSIIYYYYEYHRDNVQPIALSDGKAAVELSFRFQMPDPIYGYSVQYCGHLDSLTSFMDDIYFLDRKTTTSYLNDKYYQQFKMSIQMTGYTLASNFVYKVPAVGGIIDAVQVGQNFTYFGRNLLRRTPEQLDEFIDLVETRIEVALQQSEEALNADNELDAAAAFPMNPTACTHYGGCPFLGLCSRTPAIRERFLAADFVERKWDPLAERGVK